MKFTAYAIILFALFLAPCHVPAQEARRWENSLVLVEVTSKQYDYMQPWSKRSRSVQKTGVVIGPKEILTTAEGLADRTLVRIQKGGRGRWWNGDVKWIDYHSNLALVSAPDEKLWADLEAAPLDTGFPGKENFQIIRWRNGNLEERKTEFTQFVIDDTRLSTVAHLQMELSTEMNGLGGAEPVVRGGKIMGLITSQGGNSIRVTPTRLINRILEARKAGNFRGLGYFPFVWQPSENPAVHQHLKWTGEPRGVLVIDVPESSNTNGVLKPKDIITQIDQFPIDIQGYYKDPEYGHLILENLATQGKFAGDVVTIKVWREGAEVEIKYTIPKADYGTKLLAENLFDQEPEYLIAGGLVFTPLSVPYLRSFGGDWKRSAPFRLSYYNNDSPSKERPSLIMLSGVLPDSYNLGYHELRFLVVDKVNGQKIGKLADLPEAFKNPVNGFHTIEFMKSESIRRIVLDAGNMNNATERVLEQYRIQRASHFEGAGKSAKGEAGSQ